MSYEEGHFIGNETIHPEDATILFINILNRDAPNFIKQILQVTRTKIIMGDFTYLLLPINHPNKR